MEHYVPVLSSHIIRKHVVGYLKGLLHHKAIKDEIFANDPLTVSTLESSLARYFFEDLQREAG